MGHEPGAGLDNVVIADKQQAMMGILWVIMIAETETMPGVQPWRSSVEALLATPNINRRCRYLVPQNVCHDSSFRIGLSKPVASSTHFEYRINELLIHLISR
jgi:hypothetical protein